MARIGVFVCHCGENIARTVDCAKVAEFASRLPGVVHAVDYRYMCSDPGQRLIQEAIREKNLTGVVVASCSPHMHEVTFRRAVQRAGLNPFLCEMANIREQCSWVHQDREEATEKACELVHLMVEKVKWNQPLEPIRVPMTRKALVIGGGIAGIQAALDIANGGREVILVEKEPSIGGHMAQLSETFPTLDCSQCIMTPRMVEVKNHPRITLYTYSEVESVDGYIGNFEVKIRKKARSVDENLCTGCGECQTKCPQGKSKTTQIPNEFDMGLSRRPAIFVPFPQAVPNVPVIDRAHCRYFEDGKCGVCKKVCPAGAVDFEQEDQVITETVGAIIVATGYDVMPASHYGEYGGGRYADVIDGLQFERLLSASGPTGGEPRRPSDGKVPETVVFVACAGSRDPAHGVGYCSKICCMYTAKHAMLYKHKVHHGQAYVFYMDIRAGGKNYDEFVRRAIEEEGAVYLRGRVSRIYEKDGKLIVKGADTLSGSPVEIEADLVVLATAVQPRDGAEALAQMLKVPYDGYCFLSEAHPKLRPVETNSSGVYLAGACQAPKDIPETVAQASAAAGKVLGLFSVEEMEREPTVSRINERTCIGCFDCERVCPFGAIERKEIRDRQGNLVKLVSHVNPGVCAGCGACVTTCRSGSADLAGFSDEQVMAQIAALGVG
ncbi:MAG TPA: CoB--CoM heterodisulfide reductase iron-sulfur subunit A family protein [Armatimonadota bacterium]|nr:CoB--CoM heterodisulfide reductase iron-sulfur subunit A family protein [Armatimonadota bacterium]HPO71556.1 CoB--CoM heterodisulfide reductase iron-sulfur subunit A family protein [Armatimonadota bacterium]HPT96322.1 CoB--CoM heterodisulfide reductase iron-sulfur subunit A family protein [Armatimonadota bacterium]